MTLGTVQYYAPEQAQGEIVTRAADIYALGIVMYETLAGRTPFDGDTPVAVAMRHIQDEPDPPSVYNPRIAPGLERIVLRCLAKDPRDRYRDGDALAYALENYTRSSGGRRAATGIAPTNRPQFAPIGLPAGEARAGTGLGAYGAPAVASGGPRVTRVPSHPYDAPGMGAAPYGAAPDAPTYEGYESGAGGTSTRPWGAAPGTLPRSPSTGHPSGPYGAPRGPDDQRNRRRVSGPIIGVIVGAAVLLLGLSCFLLLALTNNLPGVGSGAPTATVGPQLVQVPNFVNMKYPDALSLAQQQRLRVNEVMQTSNNVAKDTVISQAPVAGESVTVNSYITLTVSSGQGTVAVPNLVGETLQQAQDALQAAGLVFKIGGYEPNSAPSGQVIRQDLPAGQQVPAGSTVTVYVSAGAPTPTPSPSPSPSPTATPQASPSPSVPPAPPKGP